MTFKGERLKNPNETRKNMGPVGIRISLLKRRYVERNDKNVAGLRSNKHGAMRGRTTRSREKRGGGAQ